MTQGDSNPAENQHPRRMLDRYEVVAEVARGGMGTVLLARLQGAGGFERLMAIKIMHEHLAEDGAFVAMLLDEARTAAHIQHPNAVGIVDVCESPVGYYLVMNYVEGFPLSELLSHPSMQGPERLRLGVRLLVDAARGLHAAHVATSNRGEPLGIVHRDVSPQNILVGLDGVGRIIDFGVALAASRITASRPGVIKGKPSYMSPEQAKGERCDARADVFALGSVLWEVLAGERLFEAEMDLAVLMQVLDKAIEPPSTIAPNVQPELDAVALGALERDLDRRTFSAHAFADALEAAARQVGLWPSAQEVADAIRRLFREEIATKQEAIRRHLAASVGETKPLLPGQLALIPKLSDTEPYPRSHELLQTAASGVRASGEASAPPPGGTIQLMGDPTSPPVAFTPATNPPPAAQQPSRGPRLILLAVIALLIVLVGVASGLAIGGMGGAETTAEEAPEPAPEPETPGFRPEEVPTPTPAEDTPAAAEGAPADTQPAAGEDVDAVTPVASPSQAERDRQRRRQRERQRQQERQRPATTTETTSRPATTTETPTFETNPYLNP